MLPGLPGAVIPILAEPTPLQARAPTLFGIKPETTVSGAAIG